MIPQSFLAILLNQKFTMADFSGLCVMEGKKKKGCSGEDIICLHVKATFVMKKPHYEIWLVARL